MTMALEAFCAAADLDARPVGVYDAPEPERFAPLVPLRRCLFDHYDDWQRGDTLLFDALPDFGVFAILEKPGSLEAYGRQLERHCLGAAAVGTGEPA
jgi:hypothetical protein